MTTAIPQAPPRPGQSPPPSNSGVSETFTVKRGLSRKAHRIVLYGTGGIGKSTLASLLTEVGLEPIFIDQEGGTQDMDVPRLAPAKSWTFSGIRAALASQNWNEKRVVVLDTMTKAQELAADHIVSNVKTEKGAFVNSIEDYGYGKGYKHLYDHMLLILSDLDRLCERGVNSLVICHDTRATVPNPMGEDFLRYEPNLYHSSTGKASVRDLLKGWADHLFFMAYDIAVNIDGKAQGSGTRTIYTQESPMFLAKSRTVAGEYSYPVGDAGIWKTLFGKAV